MKIQFKKCEGCGGCRNLGELFGQAFCEFNQRPIDQMEFATGCPDCLSWDGQGAAAVQAGQAEWNFLNGVQTAGKTEWALFNFGTDNGAFRNFKPLFAPFYKTGTCFIRTGKPELVKEEVGSWIN